MILPLLSLLFSFLSFNTEAMMPNDARLEPTAELLRAAGADFVYLTEEYTGQMTAALADVYPYAEKARSHRDLTERFYSKYPILDVTDIGAVKSGEYTDVWVHRVRVAVPGGDTLNLYCCHLPHDTDLRISIVEAILKDIDTVGGKAIVGGDLNSLSLSKPVRMLLGAGLRDAWRWNRWSYGATFHGLRVGIRIDYIFHTKDLKLLDISRISGSGLSDHDALLAKFALGKR